MPQERTAQAHKHQTTSRTDRKRQTQERVNMDYLQLRITVGNKIRQTTVQDAATGRLLPISRIEITEDVKDGAFATVTFPLRRHIVENAEASAQKMQEAAEILDQASKGSIGAVSRAREWCERWGIRSESP